MRTRFFIPLAALFALAPSATRAADDPAAAVTPFVGEEVAAVAHLDLTRIDVPSLVRQLLGTSADEETAREAIQAADAWVATLRKAGAKTVNVLLDPTDLPRMPVVVVPLGPGADADAIAKALMTPPARWTSAKTIRGAVVAGTPEAVDRLDKAVPAARPELAEAFNAAGDAPVRVALIPSKTQRRAFEESVPALPPQVGGAPVTVVTRDALWGVISVETLPRPALHALIRAKDADAAKALETIARNALALVAKEGGQSPEFAPLVAAVAGLKPEAKGDRLTLDADLAKTAEVLALPIRSAREAARRSQCVNNMKYLGLAMHNYASAHKDTFPPAYTKAKDGKPLLSWRVLVLPYLDQQQTLFKEFHLDEPWDSPHNKALIPRMPAVFHCPSGDTKLGREGKTTYLTPRGPLTMFPEGGDGMKIREVTDGTSNTIMVVDAGDARAVVWTKPDDWDVIPNAIADGLFGHHPIGTEFGFADGSVRFLKATISSRLLQAFTTSKGGEAISEDDL